VDECKPLMHDLPAFAKWVADRWGQKIGIVYCLSRDDTMEAGACTRSLFGST